jgi:hypothetical protein
MFTTKGRLKGDCCQFKWLNLSCFVIVKKSLPNRREKQTQLSGNGNVMRTSLVIYKIDSELEVHSLTY